MKIKMLTAMSSATFSWIPGEVYDFPEVDAVRMIEAGMAETVDEESKSVQRRQRIQNRATTGRGE